MACCYVSAVLLLALMAISAASGALTVEEKTRILKQHNQLRSVVAQGGTAGLCTFTSPTGTAANMKGLEWDDRLAADAQRLASDCTGKHDEKEDRQLPGHSWVGQNIAADWGSPPKTMEERVLGWFNECVDYTYSTGCTVGKVCGHYTQVVDTRSTMVGCGYEECPSGWRYLVCNYAPGGNYNGNKPFVAGQAASECEPGYELTEKGLCLRSDQSDTAQCSIDSCRNGGSRGEDCSCSCPSGYAGLKCQSVCANNAQYDGACKSLASQGSLDCAAYSSICSASCNMCCPRLGKDPEAANVDRVPFNVASL